MKGQVKTLQ